MKAKYNTGASHYYMYSNIENGLLFSSQQVCIVRESLGLEKLQSELHKKQSDLDHFWGLVGDAGVVLGKFGEDAKPFVDRIKEITNIVWRTQSRAEELSSDARPALLESDKEI